MEEEGYEPQNVAGASAGAIVAALLAAGYKAHDIKSNYETENLDLKRILEDQDFNDFMDKGWEDRFPKIVSILLDQGIYEGKYLQSLMEDLLSKKGVHTFGDLVHPKYADQVYVLRTSGTDRYEN